MLFKMLTQLQLSLSTVHFLFTFLTQHLGLSIFDPECSVIDYEMFCLHCTVHTSYVGMKDLKVLWAKSNLDCKYKKSS